MLTSNKDKQALIDSLEEAGLLMRSAPVEEPMHDVATDEIVRKLARQEAFIEIQNALGARVTKQQLGYELDPTFNRGLEQACRWLHELVKERT